MLCPAKSSLARLVCILAILPVTGCGRTTSLEPKGVVWGDPVNGIQAGLLAKIKDTSERTLVRSRARFVIHLGIYVRNVSEEEIRFVPRAFGPVALRSGGLSIDPADYGLGSLFSVDVAASVLNTSPVHEAIDPDTKKRVDVTGLWVGEARTGSARADVSWDCSGTLQLLLMIALVVLVIFLIGLIATDAPQRPQV